MGGFREQLLGRIIGMNGHVVIGARDGLLQATPELLAKLKDVPGVEAVRLTLERQVLVTGHGQTRGAQLRGVRREDLLNREIVSRNIVFGDLAEFGLKPGLVIGERLRQHMQVRVGEPLTVVTHQLNEGGTIAPRYSDYDILATFLSRRYEFDSTLVFIPLAALQEDLEYGKETVSSIDLFLKDPQAAPRLAQELRRSLGRDDLRVSHWLGLNARFVGALQVERVMMFIILTLIVVVAAMNVVASFTMLVRVKRGSIAILRTMGAGPGTIVRAFFMSAAAVGVAGTAIGAALGLLLCANMPAIGRALASATGGTGTAGAEVDFITSMPVRVDPFEVAFIIAVAIVLSLVAAAYPAWRATRIEPVEGLRHE
jgi:lipoprotein-releasing system permease protein